MKKLLVLIAILTSLSVCLADCNISYETTQSMSCDELIVLSFECNGEDFLRNGLQIGEYNLNGFSGKHFDHLALDKGKRGENRIISTDKIGINAIDVIDKLRSIIISE